PGAAAARHRAPEEGGAAQYSRVVRLCGYQRAFPGDEGNPAAGAATHPGASQPDSGSDASGGLTGERVHRDSGAASPASERNAALTACSGHPGQINPNPKGVRRQNKSRDLSPG